MYDMEIISAIRKDMVSRSHSLAVAESVTSGHLQAALSLAEDAGDFFHGGVTTYVLDQKSRLLKIDREHAFSCNCVSEKVASEMASGLHHLFGCDWTISVTGYAAPDPKNDRDYLYAIYAVAFQGSVLQVHTLKAPHEESLENQIFYTNSILDAFHKLL